MKKLAAGRERWRYLSDSNVEWGDDVRALAEYLKARGETRVRAALLGGSLVLPLYGVEYVDLLAPPGAEPPRTRYVALGASFLNGSTVPGWSEGSGRETPERRRDTSPSTATARRRRSSAARFTFIARSRELSLEGRKFSSHGVSRGDKRE